MKKILLQMLISLATGICFMLGITLVVLLVEGFAFPDIDELTWVGDPDGVTVVHHRPDETARDFTVTGAILNESARHWDTIHLELDVYASEALVNNCDGEVREIPSGAERNFRIKCYQVSGQNLPDNIHYRLRVRSGYLSD